MTDDDLLLAVGVGVGLLALRRATVDDAGPIVQLAPTADGGYQVPTTRAPTYDGPASPPTSAPQDGGDMIDLAAAAILGGAPDVRRWPITVHLTITNLRPITPAFDLPNAWFDVVPAGWDGPIAYTVFAFAFINGEWRGDAFIEMWRGRTDCGADPFGGDVARQLAENWWYRTPGLAGYLPSPGESIGFMVAAGDCRDSKALSIAERSNVVLVTL
jgi:hypothetical protein